MENQFRKFFLLAKVTKCDSFELLKAGENMSGNQILEEPNEIQKQIAKLALKISYRDWMRVRSAVERAFEQKERSARRTLKADAERVFYYLENP